MCQGHITTCLTKCPGYARALTYEEALRQSISPSDSDVGGILDNLTNFIVKNPAVIAGGAAIFAVPLILSQFFGDSKPWGIETAKNAYAKLAEDANAQLVDIRALSNLRQVGTPDIKSLSKNYVPIMYNGQDKPCFFLDKFDGSSELVAKLVTANGFKAAYAIKDGAEGPKGWMSSGLAWIQPKKGFSFDFSSLTDAIGGGRIFKYIAMLACGNFHGVIGFAKAKGPAMPVAVQKVPRVVVTEAVAEARRQAARQRAVNRRRGHNMKNEILMGRQGRSIPRGNNGYQWHHNVRGHHRSPLQKILSKW